MSSSRTSTAGMLVAGCLAVSATWLALGGHAGSAGQPPAGGAAQPAPEDRAADREAVRKAIDSFTAAFRKGDAKAVALHWTAEGEYVSDDGATYRGRAALEKAYSESFAKNPGNALEVEIGSIRFPSRDTAVVEGHFKLHGAKGGELVVSQCSFLYVREDGRWLIAGARESPGDGLSVRDLEWMIGTWEARRDGTVVTTRYEWTANKSFIRCQFTVRQDGQSYGGMQMIGKDPSTGLLHVWTFEDSGGIGGAAVTRDGKKWVHETSGVTPDGRILTATNILTPINADSFLWQSVERSLDDESLPDLPPVKVVRVKGKP
ncbi:MAG TPA: SgcJ/EcaC family oxidoreductase [Fimbriiglobus sp.]|nr:SgcJ/EcaC family oxidoreductase [Fimbriiglobus sp.]